MRRLASFVEGRLAQWLIPRAGGSGRATLAECAADPSGPTFDHSTWTALLKAHTADDQQIGAVAGVATVDYTGMAADARFEQYLALLASVDLTTLPRREQLALFLNACVPALPLRVARIHLRPCAPRAPCRQCAVHRRRRTWRR